MPTVLFINYPFRFINNASDDREAKLPLDARYSAVRPYLLAWMTSAWVRMHRARVWGSEFPKVNCRSMAG
jgi:hypothetical protein